MSLFLPEIGKIACVSFFLIFGGGLVGNYFDLNRLRTFPSSSSRMCIFIYIYMYMRSPKPSLPLLPQLFSSFKFKVLLHLHDPRVKFRVSLPGKTN